MLALFVGQLYSWLMKSSENRKVVALECAEPAEPMSDAAREELERAERARFLAGLQEGLADMEAGRVISDEELERNLDAWFGPLHETY